MTYPYGHWVTSTHPEWEAILADIRAGRVLVTWVRAGAIVRRAV